MSARREERLEEGLGVGEGEGCVRVEGEEEVGLGRLGLGGDLGDREGKGV